MEEKIPGITENTRKLGKDLSTEADLLYKNTIESTVDSTIAKVKNLKNLMSILSEENVFLYWYRFMRYLIPLKKI